MLKYIYDSYLYIGINPTMITAIAHALIGTVIIFGGTMLHRVFTISREIKGILSNGVSEEYWNALVDIVIRKYQIKHSAPIIVVTYAALLLVNYFIIT